MLVYKQEAPNNSTVLNKFITKKKIRISLLSNKVLRLTLNKKKTRHWHQLVTLIRKYTKIKKLTIVTYVKIFLLRDCLLYESLFHKNYTRCEFIQWIGCLIAITSVLTLFWSQSLGKSTEEYYYQNVTSQLNEVKQTI